MRSNHNQSNIQKKAAIMAGIALFIMTIAAFFSYGFVHSSLVVSGEAITTLTNIQSNTALFRMEIMGWMIIIIADLVVSWGFYLFFRLFHQAYALVGVCLRLLYTVILSIAVSHLITAGGIVRESMFTEEINRTAMQVMSSITAFEAIWSFGLILFGLHLITVGYVAMKTKHIPKPISILLILAGFGYALIHSLYTFIPQLENVTHLLELILMTPMFIGELGFGIWLLAKGRKLTIH
ncbi:DUF4386 domain-containing protein [Bacillus sp. BHET2]|uniref:DUF4386 domain-containing protein n=1 Tax=Bacillus sp. BHET2 TaxID=2583818 RepID=UPI00110D85E9|nr:DUF4386 domain-containing protein [Bacillus sp. BHET2]TMU85870.1 DUF4386 domain-containing protein [Bacillus sp. BHET2]